MVGDYGDMLLKLGIGATPVIKPTGGMASYRAFLGLGIGFDEFKYYDIAQFLDPSPAGTHLTKGSTTRWLLAWDRSMMRSSTLCH